MDFGETLLRWWPVIAFGAAMAWWVSKSIGDLKGHNDKQDAWIDENSKKITELFKLYNAMVERRLDRLDRLEDKDENH